MLHVTEVTPESIAYLVLGGFVVFFSIISYPLKERLYISEVVLGTAFGIVIGPHCAGIFDPRAWGSMSDTGNRITLEVMRVVLATGLFAIGVELPKAYLAEHVRSLLIMVVPTMAFGWFVVAGFIKALFPALSFVSSLAIAACLTPTDPVLAAAIIGGKYAIRHVPVHIRRLLSAESAANDGLAYPFLAISIYLATESSKATAFGKFFLIGCLYQVILGTVLGAILGLVFSRLMRYAHRKGLIDRESFVAQYLALAIFIIGIANTLGSDDLLAAFAAGSAVSWDGHFNARTEDEVFSSVIDLVLNCTCFIYIGAWLPFESYNDSTLGIQSWRLIVLFIAILALRRIPSTLLLYKFVPDIHDWREALFCGHFGPMGVGAIFVSTLAVTKLPRPNNPPATQNELLSASLHPIVSFIVLGSIIIHGLSIPAFWFGRKSVQRTVSLTATLSRTWTSRGGTDPPEWLFSINRTSRADVPGPDGSTTPSQTLGDIELTGTPKSGLDRGPFGDQAKVPVSSARSSVHLQLSRTASVNQLPETDGMIVRDQIEQSPKAKQADLGEESGGETAGFGYAALHEAKENEEREGQHELGDEGKMERAAEVETPRTVRFLDHRVTEQATDGDGILQIPKENFGVKQVQFVQ
ncbi:hypothetical protein ACEPAI_7834 [Sanghuangporus weigelae]